MRRTQQQAADVVRYWRAVELFSPPKLPNPRRGSARVSAREWIQQVDVRPGEPWPALPWEDRHPLRREPIDDTREVWRHTVYGGVFPLEKVREALETHFGADGEDFAGARRGGGDSAVFSLTVDARGVLLDKTTVFSTCAWATGRVRNPGPRDPQWLDGFGETEQECVEAIALLTRHHIPYLSPPAGPAPQSGGWPPSYPSPADPTPSRNWQGIVREILGSAAVGALGALIGDLGAGLIAGAVRPVATRIARLHRGEEPPAGPEPAEPGDGGAGEHPVPDAPGDGTRGQDEEEPGRPVELPDLVAFAAHVADLCGVSDLLSPASIRIHSRRVRRKRDGSLPDADPAFLNSLLPEDLERVAAAAVQGYGPALSAYLTDSESVPTGLRTDVRTVPEAVLQGVTPDAVPIGRWPSPTGEPLALSQQFAVNRITAELSGGSGLFSVNGPPGTGKTTMLRDLIAAIVVERAGALAVLDRPQSAFGAKIQWQSEGFTRTVRSLNASLTGHEIVVASSNNGAVQNITTELPALDALGPEWHSEASYFLDQAVSLLDGAPAWGAVAAPLGKAERRKEFMERYWWGEKPKKNDTGGRDQRGRTRSGRTRPEPEKASSNGMQALLQRLDRGEPLHDPPAAERFPGSATGPVPVPPETPSAGADWSAAKAEFTDAVRHAETLRAARTAACAALRNLSALTAGVAAAQQAEAAARRREQAAAEDHAAAGRALGLAREAYELARELAENHQRLRPGGLRGALGTGRGFREWQEAEDGYRRAVSDAGDALGRARTRLDTAERVRASAAAESRRAHEAARLAHGAHESAAGALASYRVRGESHLPEGWQDWSVAERELSSPWSDPEFCAARTRVFLAAMKLHRAFVVANAGTVRRNLLLLREVFAGVVPRDVALAVWQTLFLVVPVVSTTFASCGRLFGPLGKEDLGWMLIDEAGQATPQAAVGALWRSKRAVLVGDPLQLEPVVQLPVSVQERLRTAYGVGEEWLPSRTSAQRVADRTNRWGTTVDHRRADGEIDRVWVGAPLRVHRRCERTMFGLSNDIAYDGLMVYGTKEKPFPGPGLCTGCTQGNQGGCRDCVYPLSCWVDVVSAEAAGKWVPTEGDALARMLTMLHREWHIGLDRVRILSPFRDVVSECARTVRNMRLDRDVPVGATADAYRKQVSEFLSEHIGTVHTMQGKESDVVILVLGTHPRQGARARAWAAGTPNLLNVAVSRAKRRLFVIGHQETWRTEPHFELLADPGRLPRRAWSTRQTTVG